MIVADLHSHTVCSHGLGTACEMLEAGARAGLRYTSVSEHTPLPPGFRCGLYQGSLDEKFPLLMRELVSLKQGCNSLLIGLELDWTPSNFAWMRDIVQAWPFDHVLGSLHYLDGKSTGNPASWPENMPLARKFERFTSYFHEMAAMCSSGLINIVSHPDFIKLRVFDDFHKWLRLPEAETAIQTALKAMKKYGVALEINSAGLRQPFREFYPCSRILEMARQTGIEISIGSDAHRPEDIARDFDVAEAWARQRGYERYVVFFDRKPRYFEF